MTTCQLVAKTSFFLQFRLVTRGLLICLKVCVNWAASAISFRATDSNYQQPVREYSTHFPLVTCGCQFITNLSLGPCEWGLTDVMVFFLKTDYTFIAVFTLYLYLYAKCFNFYTLSNYQYKFLAVNILHYLRILYYMNVISCCFLIKI